ncbi:class I SAM-dependent methyltransferase [Chelatococcus sp. GCM10030263]|uniref:class I SAM-dependent methyltransferase n=1 Tax=Chelatococcus sp. GCM10030263 TaxID=3273387 RepID=UPI00361F5767
MPEDLAATLAGCAGGAIPAGIALMRLCLAGDEDTARAALAQAIAASEGPARERLRRVERLWRTTPEAFTLVKRVARTSEEEPAETDDVARWAKAFDTAAAISPEASVALYSLGRPDLLAAATDEVVGALRALGLVRPEGHVLDIGCGIGRFVAALAPHVAQVTGLDVSPRMLAEARRRAARLGNARLVQGNGRDFAGLAAAAFDLALAVDSFPYVVAAGPDVVAANMREIKRVLRPGGRLVILNYSYRGDQAADRAELADLAGRLGFRLLRAGERRFRHWDGALFDLERLP